MPESHDDYVGLWLKALGSGTDPLPPNWIQSRSELLKSIRFPPKRVPTLLEDDLVLYYAAGWQKIFAAAQLIRDVRHAPSGSKNYPWKADVRVFLLVPNLEYAPDLRRAGINPLSVRNKSHIRITPQQYREAVAGLAEAASFDDERYAALAG
jgi:hypothetical protein